MTLPTLHSEADLSPAFRALADPTRRAILEMLLRQSRTTGEIASHFDMTRFGVMKHLTVLVEGGLVVVRRQGRERWNHLDPMPIRLIYEGWMRSFEVEAVRRSLGSGQTP